MNIHKIKMAIGKRKGGRGMAYDGYAIDKYLNAAKVTKQLDELIKKPVYSIRPEKLEDYVENYFNTKCAGSKAMIEKASDPRRCTA